MRYIENIFSIHINGFAYMNN